MPLKLTRVGINEVLRPGTVVVADYGRVYTVPREMTGKAVIELLHAGFISHAPEGPQAA
jgi:hypothetical protein